MRITRIYTGPDGRSCFEGLTIPETRQGQSLFTDGVATTGAVFGRFEKQVTSEFHVAPQRQFCIVLSGRVCVEASDGTTREFGAGDILLSDDLTGQGHRTREIELPRLMIYVRLDSDVDTCAWRQT
jgi:EutQ-like cupin domain